MSNSKSFLRENRNDRNKRVETPNLTISDLIRTENPVQDPAGEETDSQPDPKLEQQKHYAQQEQQKIPDEIKRLGRKPSKEEPDEKMMCYLPKSLMATFKEGRLEERFLNDRAFYVHIFESYFKNKPYNQYSKGSKSSPKTD
jgi:hypothetical protein